MTEREVADRLEIADKIYRYCRAVDRLDVPLGYTVFHEDSEVVFPSFRGSGKSWIDAVCQLHLKYLHHSHQVTNIIIETHGARAGSESYVTATLRSRDANGLTQREYWGRYIDRWSRRDDEWKIDTRECVVDFNSVRNVTPLFEADRSQRNANDPSYTVMGDAADFLARA